MEIQALGYLGFAVSDLDQWAAFAADELGLMVVKREDGKIDLRVDDYAWRIRLSEGAEDDMTLVGWEVADKAALSGLAERLRSSGVAVSEGSSEICADRMVAGLIQFEDPDGLACEAFFGPLQLTQKPFVSPRGATFKTGDQGLGHIVL